MKEYYDRRAPTYDDWYLGRGRYAARDAAAWEQALSARIADRDGTRAVAQDYALECRRRYSRERMGRELCDVLGLERTPG